MRTKYGIRTDNYTMTKAALHSLPEEILTAKRIGCIKKELKIWLGGKY